jgi:hypothetical protein
MTTTRRRTRSRNRSADSDSRSLPREYRLKYGACYAYSPKGDSDTSERSRLLCARVKNGSPKWLKSYVATMSQDITHNHILCGFFQEHALLVPVPQCLSPVPTSLWVARRLAFTLQEAGLGEEVWTGLRRVSSVEKSSLASMWHRPTVHQHYRSFAVIPSPKQPSDIILIDDVITKGRTLVAAAIRLHATFPTATIRAFALVRTMGFVHDVERLFDPCEGTVHWNGQDAYRNP